MATSDNHSHKEDKSDCSAFKKPSETGNQEGHMESLVEEFKKTSLEDAKDTRRKTRVKFLINVPVGVTPEMSQKDESHCQKILDLLERTAFSEEDSFRLEDVAVVFGLNGKESEEVHVRNEFGKNVESKINFRKCMFTWRETGDSEVPFQVIRHYLKETKHTKSLVKQFRPKGSNAKIYFCFFDADTVDFNRVLSSYIDIIIEKNYPTVMSTGYVFPKSDRKLRRESKKDRKVRIITAEHFPLGTYYPEPNFCVLLPDGRKTLPEKFFCKIYQKYNMESPILIRQVKKRNNFSAVFADRKPIITTSVKKHFYTNPWTWATSAYAHRELKVTKEYKMKYKKESHKAKGFHRRLLVSLLNSEDDAQCLKMERPFEGPGAGQVFKAAEDVRKYLRRNPTKELKELEEPDETDESDETDGSDETEEPEQPENPEQTIKKILIRNLELTQSEEPKMPEKLKNQEEVKEPEP